MIRDLRAALSFLTRVPAGRGIDGPSVGRAVPWFPLVGAAVGAAVAAVYAGAREIWSPPVAAAVAVGGGALLTGAFHEDGLADVADSFGARDPEGALGAMRDPRLGSFGVLTLVMATLLRIGSIAALPSVSAFLWIPAAHAASRGAALLLIVRFPAVPGEGLAGGVADGAPARRLWGAVGVAVGISGAALSWWGAPAALAALAGAAGVGWVMRRRLGGLTGDVLGAAQQVGEVLVLLVAAGAVGVWAPPGWWWWA